MKNIFLSIAVLTSIICMNSCKNTKPAASASSVTNNNAGGSELLFQSIWKLTEVKGKMVGSESKANLAFTPGQVSTVAGSTGCNRITGTFELSGDHVIKFSPLATTRMACMDEMVSTVESNFLAALSKADHWSIVNNELLLKNGDSTIAKLMAQKPVSKEQAKLNGSWELNYLSGSKIALNGLFPGKKPTLIFKFPAPEVSGNGGCNGFSAKVTVDGNKISFGDALSTMMACEGNGEPVFFKTLKTITSYNITGDTTLTLIAGDIETMRFAKK